MKSLFSGSNSELSMIFETIPNISKLSKPVLDITKLVAASELSQESIQDVLDTYKIKELIDLKEELLDLLVTYANIILDDNIISEKERFNMAILKKYFKIKEGDFYTYRYSEVENILSRQFNKIYSDKNVNKEEATHSVALQEIFDLSYDQFEIFKQKEIKKAIELGADISNLDTATLLQLKKNENLENSD